MAKGKRFFEQFFPRVARLKELNPGHLSEARISLFSIPYTLTVNPEY